MQQWMSENQGWVDCGPRRKPRSADAGPVRVTRPNGDTEIRPAMLPTELRLVIKRGEQDPRELTPNEQAIAFPNQVRSDDDLAHMEKWARDGFCVPEADR